MPSTVRAAGATLAAGLALLASTAATAQQYPETAARGQTVRVMRDSAADRVVAKVYEGRYSFVRIETREPGAEPNQHPVTLSTDAVRALLAKVQLGGGKPEPLFSAGQLDELSEPLARALARAEAGQDIGIAAADRFGGLGPFSPLLVTTARVFVRDGRLQLIVGLVRRDADGPLRALGQLIPFETGQRRQAVDAAVQLAVAPEQGSLPRRDWVALSTQPAPAQAAAPAPAAAVVPAAPAAPAAAAPTSASDAAYQRTAERLRTLERLFKDGLISEAEYREKRREILGGV